MKIYNYILVIITALLMSTPHFAFTVPPQKSTITAEEAALLEALTKPQQKIPAWKQQHLNSLLIQAAAQGDDGEVQGYLGAGANVNVKDKYGLTALMHAAKLGHLQVVEALFEYKANPNATDNGGHDALYWAKERADLDQTIANSELKARYDEIIRLLTAG